MNLSPSDQPTVGLDALEPTAPSPQNRPAGEPFGHFILQGELGRGGMGIVYRAWEPALRRQVALKMLLTDCFDSSQLQRFHAEATAAAKLSHPNIVRVHQVGQFGDRHWFSMDLVEGSSLAQRVGKGPLPSKVAGRYLALIARAIAHAHEEGILHRDIKPSNILLDADDSPHVADFGLAKHMAADNGHTRTGALLGTPSYMAPEQACGSKNLTQATDVYGLGALLYELLTARPPFRGETTLDTVMQVIENEPVPPTLLNPKVDRDLETICLKCLSKKPENRYPTAQALAEDLERYLQDETISARSLNVLDYLGRTLERSQFDVEFRPYGNMLLVFAVFVLLTQSLTQLSMFQRWPTWTIVAMHFLKFILLGSTLWYYRPHGLLPTTTAERQMWSVWLGYLLACSTIGPYSQILHGTEAMYEGRIYATFCCVTGMAFFYLGSSYWGRCYAIGACFFGLGWVLANWPTWGAVVFGVAWSVTLVIIGLRLRALAPKESVHLEMPTIQTTNHSHR
jgi:serine/threonine protein kinase